MLDFLLESRQLAHSRYLTNIRRWRSCFPDEQLFVGYFDQLRDDPAPLFNGVLQFLDLPVQLSPEAALAANPNPGYYSSMPDAVGKSLANQLVGDMQGLHQLLKSEYTAQWLARMNYLIHGSAQKRVL